MYNNNNTKYNSQSDLEVKNKSAILFLKELAGEFDIQLNETLQQQKECKSLLREKEQEIVEKERTKTHNYDLFSPNYNRLYDTSQLNSDIKDLQQKLIDLTKEQERLTVKITNLSDVFQCMDYVVKDLNQGDKAEEEKLYKNTIENGIGFLEAQENERLRIANDLHDSTVQNLTSLVHKSELCIRLIDIDTIRAKLELTTMSSTIKTIIREMRDIIYNLKPMSLNDLGLVITLERYANQLMEAQDIKVVIHNNKEVKGILPVINITLFRIIKEACQNVIKHAKATLIDININYQEQEITVSIKDNGIGFDLESQQKSVSESSSSFGLSIMRERISLLSGTLKILTNNGMGTIVTVSVPISKCEGEKNE